MTDALNFNLRHYSLVGRAMAHAAPLSSLCEAAGGAAGVRWL